jgi:hypothetical protein
LPDLSAAQPSKAINARLSILVSRRWASRGFGAWVPMGISRACELYNVTSSWAPHNPSS